jgi:ferredoxin
MTYTIAEPCIGTKDKSCVDVCPVDCIHGADDDPQLYINPEECIDCGACEPVCPVTAIFTDYDVPDPWKEYTQLNADYFKTGRNTLSAEAPAVQPAAAAAQPTPQAEPTPVATSATEPTPSPQPAPSGQPAEAAPAPPSTSESAPIAQPTPEANRARSPRRLRHHRPRSRRLRPRSPRPRPNRQ